MWKPWIGDRFQEAGLLLLGESAYTWREGGELKEPKLSHSRDLVEWAIDNFEGCRTGGLGFIVKLSRALTRDWKPEPDKLAKAWGRAAFTNYVPTTVGVGAQTRPSPEQWAAAAEEFPALLGRIRPRGIIVLGKEMWRRMPLPSSTVSPNEREYRLSDGEAVRCRGDLRHPSRGLALEDLEREIRLLGGYTVG